MIEEKEFLERLAKHIILDPSNVCGIYPLSRDDNTEDRIEVITHMGIFKKVENPKIHIILSKKFKGEVIQINDTKYSKNYIKNIRKMASIWFHSVPEIFMMYNKEQNSFVKDSPIMFIFGSKMAFILAPRVESED